MLAVVERWNIPGENAGNDLLRANGHAFWFCSVEMTPVLTVVVADEGAIRGSAPFLSQSPPVTSTPSTPPRSLEKTKVLSAVSGIQQAGKREQRHGGWPLS